MHYSGLESIAYISFEKTTITCLDSQCGNKYTTSNVRAIISMLREKIASALFVKTFFKKVLPNSLK